MRATTLGFRSERALWLLCSSPSLERVSDQRLLSCLSGSDVQKDEDTKTYMWHHISMHIALTPLELHVLKSSDNLRKWEGEAVGAQGQELAAGCRSKPEWMRGMRGCRGRRNMKEKMLWSKLFGLFCCCFYFLTMWVKKTPLLQSYIVLF